MVRSGAGAFLWPPRTFRRRSGEASLTIVRDEVDTAQAQVEAGVLVGMLLGRYLDAPELVAAVARHVLVSWLDCRAQVGGGSSLAQWWHNYVDVTESMVGGVDRASDDELARGWARHARSLLSRP
jgi:hypothetical protein